MREPVDNKLVLAEALVRMQLYGLLGEVRNGIRCGKLYRSDRAKIATKAFGTLYELSPKEMEMVEEMRVKYPNLFFYHLVHHNLEFGEMYDFLYVPVDNSMWQRDKEEIRKDGYTPVIAKNATTGDVSEGYAIMRGAFGGLVRIE